MSTKTQTSSTQTQDNSIKYDPEALSNYHSYMSTLSPILQQLGQNPFGSPFFNQQLQMGQQQAGQQGQRNAAGILSNAQMNGFGGNMSPFVQSALARNSRATSSLNQGALFNAMQTGLGQQNMALGMMNSYQPLMTGSNSAGTANSTSQTSGLGTWLPQLLGAGLGAASSAYGSYLNHSTPSPTAGLSPFGSPGGASTSSLTSPFSSVGGFPTTPAATWLNGLTSPFGH